MRAQTHLLQELGQCNDIFPANRIFLINLLHVEPNGKREAGAATTVVLVVVKEEGRG
jgi:hypothetical protein